jgi:hypothetical protein
VTADFEGTVCQFALPAGAAPAFDPLVCPGDLLSFQEETWQGQKFRVAAVEPRGATFLVTAVQSRGEVWLGRKQTVPTLSPRKQTQQVTVQLEKHCGFPADVYGLGLVLLALLVQDAEAGANHQFLLESMHTILKARLTREPALQETLSRSPARALVYVLLAENDRRLGRLTEFDKRLDAYGQVRSLAEELLGIVLKAILRGSPLGYLTDRGDDAARGLERLRADLDSVRVALRMALTTEQAALIRDYRRAALGRLQQRLEAAGTSKPPAAPASRPLDRQRLLAAIDLSADGTAHEERESAALLAVPADSLRQQLDLLERELGGGVQAGVRARLVVLRGLKLDVIYPVYKGKNFLGRSDEEPVDIDLGDQEPVDRVWASRVHACIFAQDDGLTIEDLNSANGTYVNRDRVYPGQRRPLINGDIVQIGHVQMVVKM